MTKKQILKNELFSLLPEYSLKVGNNQYTKLPDGKLEIRGVEGFFKGHSSKLNIENNTSETINFHLKQIEETVFPSDENKIHVTNAVQQLLNIGYKMNEMEFHIDKDDYLVAFTKGDGDEMG